MRDGYLRGALSPQATERQIDVLAAFVEVGGSVAGAAELVGIRPGTVKRHLADLRARSGLTTEQLIYRGRAEGWLMVPAWNPAERSTRNRWHSAPQPPIARSGGPAPGWQVLAVPAQACATGVAEEHVARVASGVDLRVDAPAAARRPAVIRVRP